MYWLDVLFCTSTQPGLQRWKSYVKVSPVAPSQLDDGAAAVSVTPSAMGAALGLRVGAAVEIGATSGVSGLSRTTVPPSFDAVSSTRMLAPTSAAVST